MWIKISIIAIFFISLWRKYYLPEIESDNIIIKILRKILYVKRAIIDVDENNDQKAIEMIIEDIKTAPKKAHIKIFSGRLTNKVYQNESIKQEVEKAIKERHVKFEIITEKKPDEGNVFSELSLNQDYNKSITIKRVTIPISKKLMHFRIIGGHYYYLELSHHGDGDDIKRPYKRAWYRQYETDNLLSSFRQLRKSSS